MSLTVNIALKGTDGMYGTVSYYVTRPMPNGVAFATPCAAQTRPQVRRAHDERDRLSLVQRIFDDQQERAGGQPTDAGRAR